MPPFTRFSSVTHVQSYASSALAKKTSSNHQSRVPIDAGDLPTNTANEREVFIQWNGTTRSKLWVTSPHAVHHTSGLVLKCIIFISHHVWLRDHCRCPECFHSITKQRLINTFEVNLFRPVHASRVLLMGVCRFPQTWNRFPHGPHQMVLR